MRDLGEIVRVNAQAMRNVDKYGMGRRPDPHKSHGDATTAQISALSEALRHFREWWADHFEDFDSAINAQLLHLDNEAAAALEENKM